VELSREEEKALKGEYGEALATAYRILVAIGEATGAQRLIKVEWAHISGVNYNTIGDAGLKFLEDFSKGMEGRKVIIKTTINPMGYDPQKLNNLGQDFTEKQSKIIEAYERLGIKGPYTCIPYEAFELPKAGTQVSFAESNAAVFVNSMLGLITNKESSLSALASAITGKAPDSGLRNTEMRNPKVIVNVRKKLRNELDFAILGYFAGKIDEPSIGIELNENMIIDKTHAKALSASLGLSGSAGLFKIGKFEKWKEKIEFTEKDAEMIKDEISNADKGDVIVFGSPQLGLKELERLVQLMKMRKFRKRCIIFCERGIFNRAKKLGIAEKLESANAEIYCDSCSCLTPYLSKENFDSVITNSVKAAYYLRNWNKLNVSLKSMEEIVEEECE